MTEKFEKSWKFYLLVIDLIKFSDTKAAVVLATNGVILGLIFKNISNIVQLIVSPSLFFFIMAIIAICGIIAGLISIFFAIYCLVPSTDNHKSSIFFFGNITKNFKDVEAYKKEFDETISYNEEINKQVVEQIWEISKIAENKFKRVKWAILFLGIAITLLIIPIVIIGN